MGFIGEGDLAQAVAVDRQVAQGDQGESRGGNYLSDHLQTEGSLLLLLWKEDQSGTVTSLLRNGDTLQQDELMRDLYQDAGTVASYLVGTLRATVHHVLQHLHPFLHDVVRFFTCKGHHNPYATSIVLVVKAI